MGGEELSYPACSIWLSCGRTDRIVNEYGPTEATVGCAAFDIDRNNLAAFGSVPIGLPIANTRIYILDANRQHVQADARGKLYLAGDCLSEGYLDQKLTELSFVELAPSREFERAYRTGDVASYGMDGLLRYWGRNDDQLKIRGFRVERDEVCRATERLPGVRQAYFVKVQDDAGHEFLAAYLVPEPDASLAIEAVREALRSELPHYMIPDELRILQQGLPLNRNGKVDKTRLPPIERAVPSAVKSDQPVLERVLAIWRVLLGRTEIGARESFFDVGGNSISLMRMQVELETAFQCKLRLVDLFRSSTALAVASLVEATKAAASGPVPEAEATDELQTAAARRRAMMQRRTRR